jgi:hypothetical protein
MDGTPVRDMIPFNVWDRFIDGKAVNWNARIKADRKEGEEAQKRGKTKSAGDKIRGTRPSHKIADYAGTYTHPGYFPVNVALDGNALRVTYNGLEFEVKHYHYDTFQLHLERFGATMLASFSTDKRGAVSGLTVPLEPTVADILFTRQADESMSDPAFLEPFAGSYEVMGNIVVVELVGSTLKISVPGLPEYELEPIKGTEFGLKGLSGFSIEFKKDESGAVTEALVNQMGAVFIAKKK